MKVIGITGGVGTGKSAIVALAEKRPYVKAVKADEVGHLAMQTGQKEYGEITALFGTDILRADGSIDRGKLAKIVFAEKSRLAALNAVIHPFVRRHIEALIWEERRKGECRYFIIEAAILIEAGYRKLCDEIWVVTAEEKLRRQRLRQSRGYSDEKITSIMKEQMEECRLLHYADEILENNGDIKNIERKLDLLLE